MIKEFGMCGNPFPLPAIFRPLTFHNISLNFCSLSLFFASNLLQKAGKLGGRKRGRSRRLWAFGW